jgi:hypothetical protein
MLAAIATASPSLAANAISPEISVTTKNVTVAAVSADRPGYLVAHNATAGNAAGTVMGYAPVPAGTTVNVTIPLDEGASAGRPIVIMLHEETDGDGTFGTGDLAVAVGGLPVQQIVTVK